MWLDLAFILARREFFASGVFCLVHHLGVSFLQVALHGEKLWYFCHPADLHDITQDVRIMDEKGLVSHDHSLLFSYFQRDALQ